MKPLLKVVVLGAVFSALCFAQSASKPEPVAKHDDATNPTFERLKTLAGKWEAKLPDGKSAVNTFTVVSDGSAILVDMSGEGNMITMIHPDGAQTMATHYCGAKNQPRFVAENTSDPNVVTFKFKDVTNLASPDAGHMHGLVLTMVDGDHHLEEWTWIDKGKETSERFEFTRKK